MPPSTSVIERVRRQLEQEVSVSDYRSYNRQHVTRRDNVSDGKLIWIADSDTPSHDKRRAFRLSRGEKVPLTPGETKLFAHTSYERGFNEYIYEGQLRRLKDTDDPTDPRSAMRQGSGTLFYPCGALFEGKWHHGKRHGVGCLSSHKGYRYAGEWREDTPTGAGYEVFTCRAAIDAQFVNGLPQGEGVMLYNPKLNAYRYEGEWCDGRQHGKGVIFYANGDTFAGTFDHGRRHGRGITTQTRNGRELQYETEWFDGRLVGEPKLIPRSFRTKRPVSSIPYSTKGHMTAADITNWSVKEDANDIPFEHFLQLKLGFDALDLVGCGHLPISELRAVWPEKNLDMLKKLENFNKESLDLHDIFAAWYPNATAHNIARFIQEFISPFDLLRLRGYLNGVEDANSCGYYHVCGDTSPLTDTGDQRPPLHLRDLEACHYRIGGEKFTSASYAAARQLHEPPFFVDLLEIWYPNILRVTLEQYEMEEIEADMKNAIRVDFERYAYTAPNSPSYLLIDEFVLAEEKHRQRQLLSCQNNHNPSMLSIPASPVMSPTARLGYLLPPNNAIEADMRPGFIKGTVMWVLGNRIRLNISLLREIEGFYVKEKGRVTFDELLRFCFPNVSCLRTQESLLGQHSDTLCRCSICETLPVVK